ncbi:hypothetical protein PG997_001381 [Apiospora hydei]|uniref:Uncharacterized protein n=1 Tax=Apiospora hydei TaxID=1337664 RepID=A0ABR1XDJ0_9PEZI
MSDNFDYLDFNTLLNQAAYLGTHATEPDPGQASLTDSPFLGDDSLLDYNQSFGWAANAGFNQFTAPGSLYEDFDIDNTAFDTDGFLLPNNTQPFVTGTELGALSVPPLPANSAGQGFATGDILDTTTAPVIGQQRARDEFALWQPDAGCDATADQ